MEETYLIHNIGTENHSNYNKLEDILALPKNVHLGIDGVYLSVYENREALRGRNITLFVMGKFVGGDNTFDLKNVPKVEYYCTWDQIMEMHIEYGFKLGYHSYSHVSLVGLTGWRLEQEIKPLIKEMKTFAYPAGLYDDKVVEMVRDLGYEDAYSVTQGTGEKFKRKRKYLNW